MHRLTGHAKATSDVDDRRAVVEDLQHRLRTLFHQTQLHEHSTASSESAGANNPQL